MTRAPITIDTLFEVLRRHDEVRYQSPQIEKHGKRRRVRAYVTERQPDGTFRRVRKSITLGTQDESGSEIKRRAAQVLGQINAGTLIVECQFKVAELIESYRKTGLPLVANSTRGKYEAHLQKVEHAFGELELGELKPAMIQEWFIGMFDRYTQATLLDIRNVFSALFTFARTNRIWRGDIPLEGVKIRSAVEPREKRLLSAADVLRLCEELDAWPKVVQGSITGRHVRLMVLIAGVTTLRIGEILRIRAEHVSLDGRVDVRRSKTDAGRRVVYLGALADEVRGLASEGLLFARADGGPVDARDIQQHILRPCAERAFRRLSVTLHQQSGATPIETMKAAGHTKPAMTALYTLQDVDRERERAERISRRLAG